MPPTPPLKMNRQRLASLLNLTRTFIFYQFYQSKIMTYTALENAELLIVEDNDSVLSMLEFILRRAGYEVRSATSGRAAVQSVERFGLPTLALVDINMDDMNGFEFSRYLRGQSDTPIIMITAQSQTEVIVAALSEFADDYLVKPFSSEELLARIERVLRRASVASSEDWVAVDAYLRFNPERQQAKLDDRLIELTPLESKLLQLLTAYRGQTVPTHTLLNKMWPFEESTRDQLRVVVFRLRQKLQRPSTNHDYIVTERGFGYRLEVDRVP
jgi:DNA-binding response OmpR family regulator